MANSTKNGISTLENGENQRIPVAPLVSQGILDSTVTHTIGVLENRENGNQKNKDIVRYSFNFEPAVSGLSKDDNILIGKHLGEDAIKIRITCIRHGMSLEEEEHERIAKISGIKHLISQTRGTALCEGAKKKYIETIVPELQKLGINSENTYLFSCGTTEDGPMVRVKESAKILHANLGIDESRIIGNIVGLDSTDKEDDSEPRRAARTKLHNIDFAHQLLKSLENHAIRNINIVCVIHKSNIIGLGEGLLGYNIASHLSTINELETGGMITIDIDSSGKPVNNHENYGTLKLDNTNYDTIINILQHEEGLQDIFTLFNAQKIQVWEVQNYVNAYFQKHPECISRFLNDKSSSIHLRVFCLANLVIQKSYSTIENYYLSPECIRLSNEEKMIFLKNIEKPEVMNIFRRLFVCRSELWDDNDQALISKYLKNTDYDKLKKNREMYQKAKEIQGRSLDESIRKNELDTIIPQIILLKNLKWWEVIERGVENEPIDNSIDIETIITSKDSYILPAMIGSGKSIWATELVKKIITEYPEKSVVFFEGNELKTKSKGNNGKDINEKILNLLKGKVKDNPDTVLVIDAFDEIDANLETRNKILEHIKSQLRDIKVIITGRQSDFMEREEGNSFRILELSFNRDNFIRQKGGIHAEKIIKLLNTESLKDLAIDNPLLIFFICELANNKQDKNNEWLKILSLEDIIDKCKESPELLKSILYENIVKLMLVKYDKNGKFGENIEDNEERLDDILKNLSIFASGLMFGQSYKDMFNGKPHKDFFDTITILCKKYKNNNYQFAHKSFQEYFLKKAVDLRVFENDRFAIREFCRRITLYSTIEGLGLLEKIVDFPSVINTTMGITYFCRAVGQIGDKDGHALLERVVDFPIFQSGSYEMSDFCRAITEIEDPQGIPLLEKIIDSEAFRNDGNAIMEFCRAVGQTKDRNGIPLLEKIIDSEAFRNDFGARSEFCRAVGQIGDKDGHALLERVIDLEVFKNDSEAIRHFCWAVGQIGDKDGHTLLEKVVTLELLKDHTSIRDMVHWAFVRSGNMQTGLTLLKTVEAISINVPEALDTLSRLYSIYNMQKKALQFLKLNLEDRRHHPMQWCLKILLDDITINPDWDNIRNTLEFQTLIQEYKKIAHDEEF